MAHYAGPVVDAHHHLWAYDPARHPWIAGDLTLARDFGAPEYLAAAHGLDVTATVWIEAVATDPLAEAAEAAALNARDPRFAAAIVARAPLDAADLPDRLDRLAAAAPALRGIRDIVAMRPGHRSFARAPDLLECPAFLTGLRELARRNLSFDLMLEPAQMDAALRLAAAVPDLSLIVEHAGSPDFATADGAALWPRAMRAAAHHPNVSVKISALHCRIPGWTVGAIAHAIDVLLAAFGPDRLAFASDWPVHDRTLSLSEAYRSFAAAVATFSDGEQAALFARTARRLYRIEPAE